MKEAFIAVIAVCSGFVLGLWLTPTVKLNLESCPALEIRATSQSSLATNGPILTLYSPGEVRCVNTWKVQAQSPVAAIQ